MHLSGRFRFATLLVAGALIAGVTPGQQTGGNTGGAGGAGGGGGAGGAGGGGGAPAPAPTTPGGNTGGGRGTTPSGLPGSQQNTPQIPQPIFISGRVLLEDGTPVTTGQVVIERICQMRTYREGYADNKGYFSIMLGQNTGIFADASTDLTNSFGLGGTDPFGNANSSRDTNLTQLSACEIRASLPGYRSDSIPLFNVRPLNRNDVGVIVLHNFANLPGLTTSATTALAPKDARKSFERGTKALQSNKPDEAQRELLKAVGLFPRFAEAWYQLGLVYERRQHKAEAREAYAKAIGADGNYVNPYERLYLMAFAENKWDEAVSNSDRVLRLNPYEFPGAYYVNAVANYSLKQYDAAEKSAREATKISGRFAQPRSHYVLGLTLAQKGDFAGSSDSLKAFLKVAPLDTNREQVEKILADVDRLAAQAKPPQPVEP